VLHPPGIKGVDGDPPGDIPPDRQTEQYAEDGDTHAKPHADDVNESKDGEYPSELECEDLVHLFPSSCLSIHIRLGDA
jgi:hypothetical protein